MSAPLLIEIGCEEIPARMIGAATEDLRNRIVAALDRAGFPHGEAQAWGGSRRLAVRVENVAREFSEPKKVVTGPAWSAAFDSHGAPTPAAIGFAKKQKVAVSDLKRLPNPKGGEDLAGIEVQPKSRSLGEDLAASLPLLVAAMSFPKAMRWGDGAHRWVRPVHWLLALHGQEVLPLELFGVRSEGTSTGHRFLSPGKVPVAHPDRYLEVLRSSHVVVEPETRRTALREKLRKAAIAEGGELVEDDALLLEIANLVEWPGAVVGRFGTEFLDLPREILVTTLRHHQKAFSVQADDRLLPVFLAVANTDSDPKGHIRRGNEWVVRGRLEDAKFFWTEDRRTKLVSRLEALKAVTFHQKVGSYAEKTERITALAVKLAKAVGVSVEKMASARSAARLAKVDLVTGLVGEFPELQGIVGGLLLRAEGGDPAVADGIYEQYKPSGPEDSVPTSIAGSVVSVADKLDTLARLTEVGEIPTGSRDPLGLRRAANGVFRIAIERKWPLSLAKLYELASFTSAGASFLGERFQAFLREQGYTPNEIAAVLRPKVSPVDSMQWNLDDVVRRLDAIAVVRGREDFEHLVDLTKRVDNILSKNVDPIAEAGHQAARSPGYLEGHPAAVALDSMVSQHAPLMKTASDAKQYSDSVEHIARFIQPVERFFEEVLVIDPRNPAATHHRAELLSRLRTLLTSYFDIRELAGQAGRRA